ncbi:chemotaxis protein CheW [Alkalinema pantanalense CENA528]|uniref:chemotaxis protein CheW n=1 Tax=Alkalinema pantanalense TaxID=1620705 RepID=UPI003D6ED7FE
MNRSSLLTASIARTPITLDVGYLRVTLPNQMQVVLPMNSVQEVISHPIHHITAIPNMPISVLGLMNRRSQLLWLVDLANLLGIGSLELNSQTQAIVILKQDSILIGCAVTAVEGMVQLTPDEFQSVPNHTPSSLLPYLRGCIVRDANLLLILSPNAIFQSPVLQL